MRPFNGQESIPLGAAAIHPVETKMRCFKLLGERVNARRFNTQVAELQIRAAVLNRFTQLGKPIKVAIP